MTQDVKQPQIEEGNNKKRLYNLLVLSLHVSRLLKKILKKIAK